MNDEYVDGWWYGSFAFLTAERSVWRCYWSSDYTFTAVMDDFGNLVAISGYTNLRGY